MKLLHIVGNRPQFVKLTTVLRASVSHPEVQNIVVHTGQHYDFNMSDLFFQELNILKPHHYLGVGAGSSAYQTGHMIQKLEAVLTEEKPDCVMVYGDTNSTLAGALSASMLHLRFCPLPSAARNLIDERIPEERIFVTGDVTYDSYLLNVQKAESSDILDRIGVHSGQFILLTLHRAETVDVYQELAEVVDAIAAIDQPVVFPIHPRTRKRLIEYGLLQKLEKPPRLYQLEPVGYFDLIKLLKYTSVVVTDSGGVLREAFFAGRPVVSLDHKEGHRQIFKEIFEAGYAVIGKGKEGILKAVHDMTNRAFMPVKNNPFGDGKAAEKIIKILTGNLAGV